MNLSKLKNTKLIENSSNRILFTLALVISGTLNAMSLPFFSHYSLLTINSINQFDDDAYEMVYLIQPVDERMGFRIEEMVAKETTAGLDEFDSESSNCLLALLSERRKCLQVIGKTGNKLFLDKTLVETELMATFEKSVQKGEGFFRKESLIQLLQKFYFSQQQNLQYLHLQFQAFESTLDKRIKFARIKEISLETKETLAEVQMKERIMESEQLVEDAKNQALLAKAEQEFKLKLAESQQATETLLLKEHLKNKQKLLEQVRNRKQLN